MQLHSIITLTSTMHTAAQGSTTGPHSPGFLQLQHMIDNHIRTLLRILKGQFNDQIWYHLRLTTTTAPTERPHTVVCHSWSVEMKRGESVAVIYLSLLACLALGQGTEGRKHSKHYTCSSPHTHLQPQTFIANTIP